jgi:hypothetical protein
MEDNPRSPDACSRQWIGALNDLARMRFIAFRVKIREHSARMLHLYRRVLIFSNLYQYEGIKKLTADVKLQYEKR